MLQQVRRLLLTFEAVGHNADASVGCAAGVEKDREIDMRSVKSEAWKTALCVFFGVLAVSSCWHFIAKAGQNALSLFGMAAGSAAMVYVFKRTDWFD